MLKIRRPLGRLIFNMGIAIPGKTVFLIETAPRLMYHLILGMAVFSRKYIKTKCKLIHLWNTIAVYVYNTINELRIVCTHDSKMWEFHLSSHWWVVWQQMGTIVKWKCHQLEVNFMLICRLWVCLSNFLAVVMASHPLLFLWVGAEGLSDW